ncbi:MAG: hypothetical protein IH984_06445 [Planctomycetes bacterium]|nr:hypothetical protein [Planctomycetota bacterium]
MQKFMTPIALIAAVAIAATAYSVSSSSSTDRADCPGKILCPITGDPVCKDRCPLGSDDEFANADTPFASCGVLAETDTNRADCPGKIVCPLTGELVCNNRCPLSKEKIEERTVLPSCCQTSS